MATQLDPHIYKTKIKTSGEFYNVSNIPGTIQNNDIKTSGKNEINITFNIDSNEHYDGYELGHQVIPFTFDGISFTSNNENYLFDYGNVENENRISLLKDSQGYLILKIYSKKDKYKNPHCYQISYNISSWKNGEKHHIAFSNKINTKDHKDELHLFIDGFEVPNIIKFGGSQKLQSNDGYIFKTVVPEIIAGIIPRNTIAGNDLITTSGSNIVSSISADFGSALAIDHSGIGHTLFIEEAGFENSYSILPILPGDDAHQLKLASNLSFSLKDVKFSVNRYTAPTSIELMYEPNLLVSRYYLDTNINEYKEEELPGLRTSNPSYSILVDGYGQPSIVIRNKANTDDQIFIRTLGINHRRVRDTVYLWGSNSNIIDLNLPPPINLDYVNIFPVTKSKYILNTTRIRSEGYSGYTSEIITGNIISTIGILADTQPSNSVVGRTLTINVSGDNVNYTSTPSFITIHGTTFSGATNEIIQFDSSCAKNTIEQFKTISSIDVSAYITNTNKPGMSFEIKEKYQITKAENNGTAPIIRFSKQENGSNKLDGYDDIILSNNINFYHDQIGMTLVLTSPIAVAGTYTITDVIDSKMITISPNLPTSFSGNGIGKIYDISISRSGFQNGLFAFENTGITPINYNLNKGFYIFDYKTYLEIPFETKTDNAIIGNNYKGNKPANAIIEEFRTLDYQSTDTRVGENLPSIGRSITTDYINGKQFEPDKHTISLLHMNKLPIKNSAFPYKRYSSVYHQTDTSVNENFNEALYIYDKPFVIDNNKILNNNAGTIEFWVNSNFDSRNDYKYRYLFDANSCTVEEIISLTKTTIKLSKPALTVYDVKLINDSSTTIDGKNYSLGGKLSNDQQTYELGQPLPNSQTKIKVVYMTYGSAGNRLSIYKETNSNICFSIISNNKTYVLKTPIFWARDTWHRIAASWDFSVPRNGEMHLFIDGQEKVLVASGKFISGSGFVSGSIINGGAYGLNINIKDEFQTLNFGGNFIGGDIMNCKIDNIKISKIKKNFTRLYGSYVDLDYNENISQNLPVVEDLYTTYLSNFDKLDANKIKDFSILRDKEYGSFDFTIKTIDSFDIIGEDTRTKQIYEKLINILKPANTRAFIKYIK